MGLPTLAGLFPALMSEPERPGESDKDHVLNGLQILYPHFQRGSSTPALPPFEEFLSLVSAACDFPFFAEGYWEEKRRSSLRLLTDCLARRSEAAESSELLNEFASQLEYSDVVITFNWDNLVERALLAQSKNVNFTSRDENAVAVLKLHGSLNWVRVPDDLVLQEPSSVVPIAGRIVRTPDYRYYDVWDALNEPPLIVPPIASKRALSEPFFRELWHTGLNCLVDGESVAFVGYSIPPDDLQARGFLTISWATRAHKHRADPQPVDSYLLIDPNPEIYGRFSSIVGGPLRYQQGYFEKEHLPLLFPT